MNNFPSSGKYIAIGASMNHLNDGICALILFATVFILAAQNDFYKSKFTSMYALYKVWS